MTDEKLLQRAGRGDEAAFLALYERDEGGLVAAPGPLQKLLVRHPRRGTGTFAPALLQDSPC